MNSANNSILIVEDEKNLGKTLSEYLQTKNFDLSWAKSVQEARQLFSEKNFSIVLMDIGLPDGNGLDLAKELRNNNPSIVLLFLSALNDPETRVMGLEIGADDYITKPFNLRELTLRLQRILKTKESFNQMSDEITHGKLKIWFKRYEVQDAWGNIIPLSQKECAILEYLYKEKNNSVDRNLIIAEIWGADSFPSNRTVDNYIVRLRKWCETDSAKSLKIISIRGVGYKLITS